MRITQLISFLALYVWNNPAQANENAYIAAFMKEPISTCELTNLGSYWGKSYTDTKLAIGKTLSEKKPLLPIIQKANSDARAKGVKDCDFWQLDFTYDDAEIMSKVWNVDTYDAKMKLANVAANQSFAYAKKLVKEEIKRQKSAPVKKSGDQAFFASKYDYCHAKMIANAYGLKSVWEAKIWIGDIISAGNASLLENKLGFAQDQARANPQNQCLFGETRFSYKDAEKLAGMWGSTAADAKIALRDKYLYGLEFDTEQRLRK